MVTKIMTVMREMDTPRTVAEAKIQKKTPMPDDFCAEGDPEGE